VKPFTIILPVNNEAECIGPVLAEIGNTLVHWCDRWNVLLVDDYSTDGTLAAAYRTLHEMPALISENIKIIRSETHKGKDWALYKGIRQASTDIVVTMDADGQNPVYDISSIIRPLDEFDMVCGIRTNRYNCLTKSICSHVANGFRRFILRDSFHDVGCGLKAMTRSCARVVTSYTRLFTGCAHCFYPQLADMTGYRTTEVAVNDRPRLGGKSKFNAIKGRLLAGLMGCVVMKMIKYRKSLRDQRALYPKYYTDGNIFRLPESITYR